MARRLKDLYPCRTCALPVEVRSRRDIEFARCAHCSERMRTMSVANHKWANAQRLYKTHNGRYSSPAELAVGIFEACGEAFEASRWLLKAAALNPVAVDRGEWTRVAVKWARWGERLAKSMTAHLGEEAESMPHRPRLVALDVGEGEPIEASPPRVGHLTLLPR